MGFPFGEDTGLLRGFCSFADASAKQRRGLIEEFKRWCRQFIMMNDWLASDFGGKLREDRLFFVAGFLAPRLMVAGFLAARRCVCVVIFPI